MPSGPRLAAILLAILVATAGLTIAQSEYTVTVDPAVDTPPREVTFEGGTYEVSQFGRVDPGEPVDATVSAPAGEDYVVFLYNSEREIVDRHRFPEDRTVTFETENAAGSYEPGTYAVAVSHDGAFQDVTPLVIAGYYVEASAPSSAEQGSEVTVEASVSEVAETDPVEAVRVVIGNDDENRSVTMSDAGDRDYTETFTADRLSAGDYSLYVVVQGPDTALGRQEVLGVSTSRGFSVTSSGDTSTDDGSSGDGGEDPPGSPTATTTDAGGTATPTSTPTDADGTDTSTTDDGDTVTPGTSAATPTDDPSVITPNEPTTDAPSTEGPGQSLGVLPALLGLLLAALLAGRRR